MPTPLPSCYKRRRRASQSLKRHRPRRTTHFSVATGQEGQENSFHPPKGQKLGAIFGMKPSQVSCRTLTQAQVRPCPRRQRQRRAITSRVSHSLVSDIFSL